MSLLAASGLCVERAGRRILDDITLAADAGEFIAVIGPNGAGKSTLLRLLAGLQNPDRGSVTLDGEPLAGYDLRKLAGRRAFLPQGARCEWPIAVERLVGLGLTPTLPALGDFTADDRARIDGRSAGADGGRTAGRPRPAAYAAGCATPAGAGRRTGQARDRHRP